MAWTLCAGPRRRLPFAATYVGNSPRHCGASLASIDSSARKIRPSLGVHADPWPRFSHVFRMPESKFGTIHAGLWPDYSFKTLDWFTPEQEFCKMFPDAIDFIRQEEKYLKSEGLYDDELLRRELRGP